MVLCYYSTFYVSAQLTFCTLHYIILLALFAGMMELVDMRDLGSRGVIR